MAWRIKRERLAKVILNGALGIVVEALAVVLVMFVCFLVCAAWWRVF